MGKQHTACWLSVCWFQSKWELAGRTSQQGTQKMIHIMFGLFALLENVLCASQEIGPKLGPK